MKYLLLCLYSTTLLSAENPKTHMLILGGSGDPAGNSTMFDKALNQVSDYYNSKKRNGELGQSSIAFNGGHSETESIKNNFTNANSVQNFTQNTYLQEIERFKTLMADPNVFKSGDQLLVYVNSHGTEADKAPKTTHSIATGDAAIANLTTGAGATLVSIDQLAELKKVAKEHGVRLGIVDLSCHSGNSQSLSDDNTCVVSATGKNHYAYNQGGFNGTFSKNIERGASLESAFLKTREEDSEADFPMISSPEGQLIQNQIYSLLTPYLQYRSNPNPVTGSVAEKLSEELLKAATDPVYACKKNHAFDQLNKLLEEIDKNTSIVRTRFIFKTKESITDFEELKKTLKEYKDIQDLLIEQLKGMHVDKLQKKEVIDPSNSYSWEELLKTEYEPLIANYQRRLSNSSLTAEARETNEYNLFIFTKAKETKERIIRENPGINAYKAVVANFDNGQEKTEQLAKKIATLEKKLYNGVYKKYVHDTTVSNPCRDFKL